MQPLLAERAECEQRLLERFRALDDERASAAIELLGCVGSEASVPLVLQARVNPATHAPAVRTLSKIADARMLAWLGARRVGPRSAGRDYRGGAGPGRQTNFGFCTCSSRRILMSRFWIGFVASCGVVAGTLFACQLGTAAEPVSGSTAPGAPGGFRPLRRGKSSESLRPGHGGRKAS